MTFRTKMMTIIAVLCALSFLAGVCIANASSTMKVIGKAEIKKGTKLGGMLAVAPGVYRPFQFIAFEDTEVYLIEKMAPTNTAPGGYIADAEGFPHDCPTHGKEPLGPGLIGIPQPIIDDGTVKVTIYGE